MVGGGFFRADSGMEESGETLKEAEETRAPLAPMLGVACGLLGIQFCWSVQIGYVTKALLELGVSRQYVALAWLAGPIAGIIMQPIVGWFSDRNKSRWGRRRPYIVAGILISIVMMVIFGYGRRIGDLLGDKETHPRAITVSILAFWCLDFSINAAQGPVRTLLIDIAPPSQQAEGNSYLALGTSLGNFLGSMLGSVDLRTVFPFFYDDVSAIYTVGAGVLFFTTLICVIVAKEEPATEDEIAAMDANQEGGWATLKRTALEAPSTYWKVYVINCFTWFAWFTLFIYGTSWVGAEVMGGSEKADEGTEARDLYDNGVRLGNLGFSLQSVVAAGYSLILNWLLSSFGKVGPYIFSQSIQAAVLLSTLFVRKASTAIALFASLGLCWANSMAVPWAIIGEIAGRNSPDLAGMYITIFNSSQAFPEVLVSLITQGVAQITSSQTVILVMGGIVALIGALGLCIVPLDIPVLDQYF